MLLNHSKLPYQAQQNLSTKFNNSKNNVKNLSALYWTCFPRESKQHLSSRVFTHLFISH